MFFRRTMPKYADVYQPTQKVYIRWDGSQERLLIQTKYEGPAEEMVWIVPVPSEPTVERADPNLFTELSKQTQWPDLSVTNFVALRYTTFGRRIGSDPVEWHDRIGDYDVALLSPVGAEDVIAWLNANDFAVPAEAVPILADYIDKRWWMVAARIHPDALTEITQEALAKGALHPLDMRFETSQCVYPLRLTSLTDGPVEELIYIEGPNHYQPATLAAGDWDMQVFGGTIRTVPDETGYSAVDHALEIRAGRVTTKPQRYLTKLRRTFAPEEMTNDLRFEPMDYRRLLASGEPNQVGQGATQLGRRRDPNGVAGLLAAISSDALERSHAPAPGVDPMLDPSAPVLSHEWLFGHSVLCKSQRSCIWALGEIAVEHDLGPEVEAALLHCAAYRCQIIRMEAYTALLKLGSRKLGPPLIDQWAGGYGLVIPSLGALGLWRASGTIVTAELDMAADWIQRFGTAQEKDALGGAIAKLLAGLPAKLDGVDIRGWGNRTPTGSSGWVIWRAALAEDASLLTALQEYRLHLAGSDVERVLPFLLTAEAACGSSKAVASAARLLVEDQSKLEISDSDGHAYFPSMGPGTSAFRLRDWIISRLKPRFPHQRYIMPAGACDTITRAALAADELDDWWVLYLLGRLNAHQAIDKERLMQVWNRNAGPVRVVAVDLFYIWGDTEALLGLRDRAENPEVQAEITWALSELGIGQAAVVPGP